MKTNRIIGFLFLFLFSFVCNCVNAQEISLIPQPKSLTVGEGSFNFGKSVKVCVADYPGDSVLMVLNTFKNDFSAATGLKVKTVRRASRADIVLAIDGKLGAEAYALNVTGKQINIKASKPAGFFYALQTLKQLMPRNVMAGVADTSVEQWSVPCVNIADEPRFVWRGFMLDEGRHFYGVDAVKTVLDLMATYKMNRFHWHLTEDQGWRVEIKKYPKLTEVGAWRNTNVLAAGEYTTDGIYYGGYYSQEQVAEIVAYAKERFIEIVPEIDIPGHSQAAVASYPEFLACDPQNKHEVWLRQGISADVINVANPRAVQFTKDVIDELIEMFPFGYIHLGGDECPTYKWERNDECKALLKEIGSENYRDLQIHFYKQLKDHIAAKPAGEQRRLIFWNEVLHGNTESLGEDITIMAWIGADKAAKDAVSRGMTTVLSPQIPYYINRKQSRLETEPHSQGYGDETVERVYNYVPMKNADAGTEQNYLGVQANFWTEWVTEAKVVEYLMLPRLAAVAEAGWTPQELRNYEDFKKRMQGEAKFYQLKGVDYGKHIFE